MIENKIWNISWDGEYNSGFRGNKQISNVTDLTETLKIWDSGGNAEFVLYRKDMKHQNLTISVSRDRWYLYFFPEDDSVCGFQSLGDDRNNNETTHLPAGGDIEVCNYCLVTSDVALKVAVEFMETGEMPSCIEWDEL